ncbi:unnamed protein product [Phytophthora fragariaefolia]|uniref:Unnamed protein product n=1 Tax=Phytophthora fragariaefolia TaxID=1490495 RepID=A0A9W6X0D3_9STRA|nr:unnamed protein product [Phytophthora fragariaefolia]
MKIAAIAATLVYLVSVVMAADTMDAGMASDQAMNPSLRGHGGTSLVTPVGVIANSVNAQNNNVLVSKSNIVLSKSDRVQLADTIKEMLATHPEVDPAAAELLLEQDGSGTSSTVANVATNRAVISNAVSAVMAGINRNPAAVAGHVVGMVSAAYPVVVAPPSGPAPRYSPNPGRYVPRMSSTAVGSAADNNPASPSSPTSPSS